MGDLEHVDSGQATLGESRIDVVLDVAGQQEAARIDDPEEHDRHSVDAASLVGRLDGDRAPIRPQHGEPDRVEGQPIARRQSAARHAVTR